MWIVPGTLSFPRQPDSVTLMVGPGTGCAPFRARVQERVGEGRAGEGEEGRAGEGEEGKPREVLFFGCRNREADFFFADEWLPLVECGKLQLFTAFSRDQVSCCNGCPVRCVCIPSSSHLPVGPLPCGCGATPPVAVRRRRCMCSTS